MRPLALPLVTAIVALTVPLGVTSATGATTTAGASYAESAHTVTALSDFGQSVDPQDESTVTCADLLVIGARGSGESAGIENGYGEYGFGPIVGYAVDRLHEALDSTRTVRYEALDYPALATSVLTDDLSLFNTTGLAWGGQSAYLASIDEGSVEMRRLLQQSASSCPDERWILVGYSQGALVIDQSVAPWPDARRFAGIIRIADPGRQVSQAAPNLGDATAGNGIATVSGSQVVDFPFRDNAAVSVDLCDARDLVCDTSNWIADVVSSAPPGVSAVLTPAAIDEGIAIHVAYPRSRVNALVDAILPRIRAVPIPSERHFTITRCGPAVGANGLATITEKATVAGRPADAAPVAWSGGYYAAADGSSFAIDSDGTWQATLPPGSYSIPLTVTAAGQLTAHAWLDVSISLSCEEMYSCGPEHPAPTGAIDHNLYNWSNRAPAPTRYDRTFVVGQVLCPSGLPAAGVAVSYCPEPSSRCQTGYWVTDTRGFYRMPVSSADQDIWINTYLAGYPGMTGGDPRAGWDDPEASLYVSDGDTVRAPLQRFTEFATITVQTDIAASPWFTGRPDGIELAGYVFATDDDPDYAANRLRLSAADSSSNEFCVRYSGADCFPAGSGGGSFARGKTVTLRVLPGTHHLYWTAGGTYPEWWGSDEVDACGARSYGVVDCPEDYNERVAPSARAVTVAPGESIHLGTKTLSHVSNVTGVMRDVRGLDVAELPINTYRLVDGEWTFTSKGEWDSTRVRGDVISQTSWQFEALPGPLKIVVNDPQSADYDPTFETLFYPGSRSIADAATVDMKRGVRIFDLYMEYPAKKGSAEAALGMVSGRVADTTGAPLRHVNVGISNGFDYGSGLTDVLGNYAISKVKHGTYTASARDNLGRQQWWNNAASEAAATTFSVAAGTGRTGIDFTIDMTVPVVEELSYGWPTISGKAQVGSTLTADANLSMWSPTPDTVTYQWMRDGTAVGGATASTYALTSADADTCLGVRVTGTKTGYHAASVTADCVMVARGSVTGSTPTITGTARVGATVTAKPGSWMSGAALSFRWYRGSSAISGATRSTYTLTAADSGQKVTVKVTGSRSGYDSLTKTSAATAIAPGALTAATPTISGTAKVGLTLSAKRGTWTSGTTFSYQWFVGGKKISGATTSTFTVRSADRGKTVKVAVTGKKSGYTTRTTTSRSTGTVAAASRLKVAIPKISGTAKVGGKLTAKPGAWTSGTTLSYQWLVGGKKVSGATKSTFTVRRSDKGKTVKVAVTGKKPGYTTATKTSVATAKVK